jgi:hypothetical protein
MCNWWWFEAILKFALKNQIASLTQFLLCCAISVCMITNILKIVCKAIYKLRMIEYCCECCMVWILWKRLRKCGFLVAMFIFTRNMFFQKCKIELKNFGKINWGSGSRVFFLKTRCIFKKKNHRDVFYTFCSVSSKLWHFQFVLESIKEI